MKNTNEERSETIDFDYFSPDSTFENYQNPRANYNPLAQGQGPSVPAQNYPGQIQQRPAPSIPQPAAQSSDPWSYPSPQCNQPQSANPYYQQPAYSQQNQSVNSEQSYATSKRPHPLTWQKDWEQEDESAGMNTETGTNTEMNSYEKSRPSDQRVEPGQKLSNPYVNDPDYAAYLAYARAQGYPVSPNYPEYPGNSNYSGNQNYPDYPIPVPGQENQQKRMQEVQSVSNQTPCQQQQGQNLTERTDRQTLEQNIYQPIEDGPDLSYFQKRYSSYPPEIAELYYLKDQKKRLLAYLNQKLGWQMNGGESDSQKSGYCTKDIMLSFDLDKNRAFNLIKKAGRELPDCVLSRNPYTISKQGVLYLELHGPIKNRIQVIYRHVNYLRLLHYEVDQIQQEKLEKESYDSLEQSIPNEQKIAQEIEKGYARFPYSSWRGEN